MGVAAGLLFAAWLSLGCSHLGPGIAGTPCPVPWVPTESIDPASASLRARIELNVRDKQIHLEIIARGQPDEMIVVGLARFGVRLFALHQRGTEVSVTGARDFQLEQVALWVMDALHRAVWISPPEARVDLPEDEPLHWSRSGERIQQSLVGGLTRREFFYPDSVEELGGDATPRVTIDYLGAPNRRSDSASEPVQQQTITIQNPWCGYEATIAPL